MQSEIEIPPGFSLLEGFDCPTVFVHVERPIRPLSEIIVRETHRAITSTVLCEDDGSTVIFHTESGMRRVEDTNLGAFAISPSSPAEIGNIETAAHRLHEALENADEDERIIWKDATGTVTELTAADLVLDEEGVCLNNGFHLFDWSEVAGSTIAEGGISLFLVDGAYLSFSEHDLLELAA